MKNLILIIFVTLFVTSVFPQEKGTFTDSRDGKIYKTVKIGEQWWMAENLNYKTDYGSWCYDDNIKNCNTYGRLYNWETAKNACPSGWHLPSDNEWMTMEKVLGLTDTYSTNWVKRGLDEKIGEKLKNKNGWGFTNENATNESGFSALPSGCRNYEGIYGNLGESCDFWTSTEYDNTYAWSRFIVNDSKMIGRFTFTKENGYYVRCVQGLQKNENIYIEKKDPNCIIGDCKNEYGIYRWEDGSKYEGYFQDGEKHGYGTYRLEDRQLEAIGNFNNGKLSNGKLNYFDGDTYIGELYVGAFSPHGKGKFISKVDKSYAIGTFSYGALNGEASVYDKNDNWQFDGIFENGVLIEKTKVNSTIEAKDIIALGLFIGGVAAIIDAASDDNSSSNSEISKNSSNSNSSNNTTTPNNSASTSSNSTPSKNNYSLGDKFWIKSNGRFELSSKRFVYQVTVIDYTAVKVQFEVTYEECDHKLGSTDICCADCKVWVIGSIGNKFWCTKEQANQCFSKFKPSCY